MNRTTIAFYLISLALLPWSKFPPFPWLHENAQWSDVVFSCAAGLWLLECCRRRQWPRLRSLHIAMGLYLLAATTSLLLAAPDRSVGAMKLLGMAELSMIAIVTSDLSRRPAVLRNVSRVVAATSLLAAGAAIAGVGLFYLGARTLLIGTYGDHLIPSARYARAQAAFSHPNLLASFCIFAAAISQGEKAGLPKKLRGMVQISLWTTVILTLSHSMLGFMLAASIRRARDPRARRRVLVFGVLLLLAVASITCLNWSIDLENPASTRVRWDVSSGRAQTFFSALRTLAAHPILGSGVGTSPGWFREMPYDAHLTLLNIAATMGLPALAAFVWLFLILWRERERPTDLCLWGAFAGLALDSLIMDIEDFRHLWVLIGLADAQSFKNRLEEMS